MAKRAPADEKPFRPLDESVLSSVLQHKTVNRTLPGTLSPKVVELTTGQQVEQRREPAGQPVVADQGRRLNKEMRILYTSQERMGLDRLMNAMSMRLGAQIKASHVLRALTALILNAESQIDQRAGEHGSLTRPHNGDASALLRFEWEIAVLLANAIRDAGVPRKP